MRVLIAIVSALLLVPTPGSADETREHRRTPADGERPPADKAEAKIHYVKARKLYNLSDYKGAEEEFKAAYLAVPDPVFLFNLGQCARMLGAPEEALHNYRAYLREQPQAANRGDVETFIADEEREIQRRLSARPPTGTLPSGELKPTPSDTAPANASHPVESTASVEAAPRPRRWWIWAVVGVGAALVAAGAITLAVVLGSPTDAAIPSTADGHFTPVFH